VISILSEKAMKDFLRKVLEEKATAQDHGRISPAELVDCTGGKPPPARIAVYDSLASAPRVVELSAQDYEEFINLLATKTYQLSQEKGGSIPFTVIREIVENLIHAYFREAVITILDNGNTIRISDQGPGIKDKEKTLQPGFTTATQGMKKIIRGVGSGLPIVREALVCAKGNVIIEDNLERGTVITLSVPGRKESHQGGAVAESAGPAPHEVPRFKLSSRQKRVLFLVTELGAVGPSKVADELDVSLSTAYRDLLRLEKEGLVELGDRGRRGLTSLGVKCLDVILTS